MGSSAKQRTDKASDGQKKRLAEAGGGLGRGVALSPATLSPAVLSPAVLSPATLSPATLGPATLGPATLRPAVLSPATLSCRLSAACVAWLSWAPLGQASRCNSAFLSRSDAVFAPERNKIG